MRACNKAPIYLYANKNGDEEASIDLAWQPNSRDAPNMNYEYVVVVSCLLLDRFAVAIAHPRHARTDGTTTFGIGHTKYLKR